MKEDIEKRATGQRKNILLKIWQEDCEKNEEISKKRWETVNLKWLKRYETGFIEKHRDKTPFVKDAENAKKNHKQKQQNKIIRSAMNPQIQQVNDSEGWDIQRKHNFNAVVLINHLYSVTLNWLLFIYLYVLRAKLIIFEIYTSI